MRGANVVRKRSVTNPGDPAGAAGAVSGGPAYGEGSVPLAGGPLAGGSATGDGSDAVGGRDAASLGPRPVIGPAASGGQTPVVAAQPQAEPPPAAGLVGTTHPPPSRPGSARSRFALSNWRVRWRLAALIAVPLLTAVVLGALTISRNVSTWQTAGRVQHLAQLNIAVGEYIQAVENERDYSVASTANRASYSARLKTARRVTDGAAAEVAALADGVTVGAGYQLAAVQAVNAVQVSAKTLPYAREAVADSRFPMTGIMQVYTVNVIQPANTFTSTVGNEAGNTNLRHDVISLGSLLQAQDAKSVQRALLLRAVSFPQPTLLPDDVASLQQAIQQEKADLANFKASVDPAEQLNYANTVTGPQVDIAATQETSALALLPGASSAHPLTPANARTLSAANVNNDWSFSIGKVRQVADELNGNISTLANTSRNNASTGLLVTSLVTLLLNQDVQAGAASAAAATTAATTAAEARRPAAGAGEGRRREDQQCDEREQDRDRGAPAGDAARAVGLCGAPAERHRITRLPAVRAARRRARPAARADRRDSCFAPAGRRRRARSRARRPPARAP